VAVLLGAAELQVATSKEFTIQDKHAQPCLASEGKQGKIEFCTLSR
jgi:hypothetical protein